MGWRDAPIEEAAGSRWAQAPIENDEQDDRGRFRQAFDRLDELGGIAAAGVYGYLPQGAQDWIKETGEPYGIGQQIGREPEGAVERGAQVVGQSLPFAAGGLALGKARQTAGAVNQAIPRLAGRGGPAPQVQLGTPAAGDASLRASAARLSDDAVRFAGNRPATAGASELMGSFGAGVGMHAGAESGIPGAETAGGILGGITAGGAPLAGDAMRRTGRRLAEDLLPGSELGGRLRAARQMQNRVEEPSVALRNLDQAPDGVAPGRATRDPRLMAQEQRVLADNPSLDYKVRQSLADAQEVTQRNLRDSFGQPVPRSEWERRVIQEVAAPNAQVSGSTTDDMIRQAARSFDDAYAPFKQFDVDVTGMGQVLGDAVNDPAVFAGKAARDTTRSWLNSQLKNIDATRVQDGSTTTGDLLSLRQAVRAKQRQLGASAHNDPDARQSRDVLRNVEDRLTDRLEQSMPDDALDALRAVDQRYRTYKVVEDAVYRGGEAGLTPEKMQQAIRSHSFSSGQYAQGSDAALRGMSTDAQDVARIINDPAALRNLASRLDDEGRRSLKAGYAQALYNTARTTDPNTGADVVDGAKLTRLLRDHSDSATALGLTSTEKARMGRVAQELQTMQQKSPEAVAQLFEDGPANILQLGAAIFGSKVGQRTAGGGIGSSLVLAHFFSNKARQALARLTSDKATEIMTRAHTDPDLYRALLVGPTSSTRQQDQAAKVLRSYLGPVTLGAAEEAEEAGVGRDFIERTRNTDWTRNLPQGLADPRERARELTGGDNR